ncbi:MAG: sigma-54-dependent Fis family transcriptional regulator [Rhizobiales bacterium]|nr:sigma-54-dependent Fis family transcriptional regulator [Hyphomicrobiales bacterium]
MKKDIRIVIIDDDLEISEALYEMLCLEGFKVVVYSDAKTALARLSVDSAVVILSDVKMPNMDGISLLAKIQNLDDSIPVLLMSGHGDIPMALQAIKDGAYDFLEKPLDPEILVSQLKRAVDKRSLTLENRSLKQDLENLSGIDKFILGNSVTIKNIRKSIISLCAANVDTIIYGATGSGKDRVAQALHKYSKRCDKRFIAINCGGMSENLIESELFGHEAGSFTGATKRHIGKIEAANGGTLFLDEIETMPISVQIKFLRVLQNRTIERVGSTISIPIEMTVIVASKADLAQLSEVGDFRKDLFYRLNVASINIPPLCERPDDIMPLYQHYLSKAAKRYDREIPELLPQDINALLQHNWPGNVRELRNAADRFVLGILENNMHNIDNKEAALVSYEQRMDKFEKQLLEEGLRIAKGQVSEAAILLDLTQKTLYRKMLKHQLDKSFFKND